MKIDFITATDYNKSKILFQNCLDSSDISSHILIYGINKIKYWVHYDIILHDNYYAFFIRKLIFHMVIISDSAL